MLDEVTDWLLSAIGEDALGSTVSAVIVFSVLDDVISVVCPLGSMVSAVVVLSASDDVLLLAMCSFESTAFVVVVVTMWRSVVVLVSMLGGVVVVMSMLGGVVVVVTMFGSVVVVAGVGESTTDSLETMEMRS